MDVVAPADRGLISSKGSPAELSPAAGTDAGQPVEPVLRGTRPASADHLPPPPWRTLTGLITLNREAMHRKGATHEAAYGG